MVWLPWLSIGLIIGWLIEFVIDYRFWQRRYENCATELARLRGQIANFESRALNAEQNAERSNSKLREASETLHKAQQELTVSYTIQDSLRKNIQVLEERVDNWGRKIGLIASSKGLLSNVGVAFSQDNDDDLRSQIAAITTHLSLQPSVSSIIVDLPASASDGLSNMPVRVGLDQAANDPLYEINGIGAVYEQQLNAAGIYTFQQLIEIGAQRLHEIVAPQEWQSVNTSDWINQAQEILATHR